MIEILKDINRIKPVWVELGLQTAHEKTADYIRRGYPLAVYDDAVARLKAAGLTVITHMIVGLPYESGRDILHTAEHIAAAGSDGIKLQQLYVLKGTDLETEYRCRKFSVLTKEAYINILIDIIEILPTHMVIHRLTGDGDKKNLIAPLWSANKKDVLNCLFKIMNEKEIHQGRRWVKSN